MKVCMVAYTFYENDNRVRRYAEALAKRGDEVDAVALRSNGDPPHEVIEGVNVHRIQRRVYNERSKFDYLSRLLQFLVRSFLFLAKASETKKYDVVHVHNIPDFEVFAALVPKLAGARVILDIHDILPEFYASKFGGRTRSLVFKTLVFLERISIRFADHVIISNHIWQDRLLSRSVENGKCSVIMNYPDPTIFYPRNHVKKEDRLLFIYAGTLNHHQGVDIAIRALARVRDRIPRFEFHVYGDGAERDHLQALTRNLQLEDRVFFKGRLPIDRVAEAMAHADIGIVPKRNDSFGGEAFSTKIWELMALGVPLLVSETRIDRHYFNDTIVNFFRPDDDEDLAENIATMVTRPEERERLASRASEYVKSKNWDAKKQEYFDLIDKLVN